MAELQLAATAFSSAVVNLAIPIATIFGYIIWDEIPTSNQISGGALVVASCLLITYREMKKNKN